jgi:hypothetical protein
MKPIAILEPSVCIDYCRSVRDRGQIEQGTDVATRNFGHFNGSYGKISHRRLEAQVHPRSTHWGDAKVASTITHLSVSRPNAGKGRRSSALRGVPT